jgi:hypothetical protein
MLLECLSPTGGLWATGTPTWHAPLAHIHGLARLLRTVWALKQLTMLACLRLTLEKPLQGVGWVRDNKSELAASAQATSE